MAAAPEPGLADDAAITASAAASATDAGAAVATADEASNDGGDGGGCGGCSSTSVARTASLRAVKIGGIDNRQSIRSRKTWVIENGVFTFSWEML